jgi:hypothetical protein
MVRNNGSRSNFDSIFLSTNPSKIGDNFGDQSIKLIPGCNVGKIQRIIFHQILSKRLRITANIYDDSPNVLSMVASALIYSGFRHRRTTVDNNI